MPSKAPVSRRVKTMAQLMENAAEPVEACVLPPAQRGQRLILIPLDQLHPFSGHPFRLYTGERLEDMVESIRQNGILMPLIVRPSPNGDGYELLSGHNRRNAGALAGLDSALCLVKEGLSDAEALMYVIETNLMQRSFSELLPSEKAAVLALHYSKMFSQGKRNDIVRELESLESTDRAGTKTCGTQCHKSSGNPEESTCGTECHKLKTRDKIGAEYSLKGRAVAKYLRIGKLVDPLKLRVDDGGLTIASGVSLSYLCDENQLRVDSVLRKFSAKLTDAKATALRTHGEAGLLTAQVIEEVLASGRKREKSRSVRLRPETYALYFTPGTTEKEVAHIIDKALSLYFSQ